MGVRFWFGGKNKKKAKNTTNELMLKRTSVKLSDQNEALLTVRFWQW
jgi:hypothetical protein